MPLYAILYYVVLLLGMKNRSRTDIIRQMLEAAASANGNDGSRNGDGGATKTQIMYKSFISFGQLNPYLSLLLENKLLDYDKRTAQYKVTNKGHKFLKAMDEMPRITTSSTTNEIELIA